MSVPNPSAQDDEASLVPAVLVVSEAVGSVGWHSRRKAGSLQVGQGPLQATAQQRWKKLKHLQQYKPREVLSGSWHMGQSSSVLVVP